MAPERFTEIKNEFFSKEWWDVVIAEWNECNSRNKLAKLGTVGFKMTGPPEKTVTIHWDETGTAKIVPDSNGSDNSFKATRENWMRFLAGDFKATMGVLQGKIEFKGKLFHILPYTDSFNDLARVSKKYLEG